MLRELLICAIKRHMANPAQDPKNNRNWRTIVDGWLLLRRRVRNKKQTQPVLPVFVVRFVPSQSPAECRMLHLNL